MGFHVAVVSTSKVYGLRQLQWFRNIPKMALGPVWVHT